MNTQGTRNGMEVKRESNEEREKEREKRRERARARKGKGEGEGERERERAGWEIAAKERGSLEGKKLEMQHGGWESVAIITKRRQLNANTRLEEEDGGISSHRVGRGWRNDAEKSIGPCSTL